MSVQRAVVIGTGFGGAVASCRLAQAGVEVTVLERGRRYDGEIPAFPRGEPCEWLWSSSRGLFDVRAISEVQVVEAAGYGGGSLIYANVHLRAPAEVFDRSWPDGYSRDALDPYYDLVAYMLDIQPIDRSPRGVPPRAERMAAAAAALDRSGQLIHPPLAVNFAPEPGPNKFGVMQRGCIHCGECILGCVQRAKNTLDFNYLAIAERLGARIMTECEVSRSEPRGEGVSGYRVVYRDHRAGQDCAVEAEQVFLCAGAINSTEILLRSRASGALPRISARLGEGYSGNGDLLAFAFDTDPPVEADSGPTINTALLHASPRGWFLIEDGGFPRMIWPLVAAIEPLPVGLSPPEGEAAPTSRSEVAARLRAAADAGMPAPAGGFVDAGRMAGAAVFLAMGRDLANGRIELLTNGALCLRWDVPSNLEIYSLEERLIRDLAGRLGGTYRANPFWRFLRQPVTVHNLGGCVMGRSEADGVTDALGEVFNYPALFVMDGAILPRATGVNPAHTIAAVAERNVELIIRRTLGDPMWTPPERSRAARFQDPLSHVAVPPVGTRPPDTPAVGLTFRERLAGSWERPGAADPGRMARAELHITIDDVDRFIADPAHVGIITGRITLDGLTGAKGAEVQNGVWNAFVAPGPGPERQIRYTLPFHGKDGVLYALRGMQVFRADPGLSIWGESTVLGFQIGPEAKGGAAAVGRGVMRIGIFGILSLVASTRVLGAPNPSVARRTLLDFVAFCRANLGRAARAPR